RCRLCGPEAATAEQASPVRWLIALAWVHLERCELRELRRRLKQAEVTLSLDPDGLIGVVAYLAWSAGKPGGMLIIMNDSDRPAGRGANAGRAVNDPERLAEYEARTRDPLDLLALATLWLVVVPWWDYGHVARYIVLAFRVALSVVYGIDIAIRSALAPRHLRYALTHPIALASVLYPPVRVFFSIRLVRSMFRRGHLPRFLTAAVVLVLNGAVIVYLFERHAPGSNIHTLRDALWWAFVTVTTVGYGDFYPVTAAGRVTACFIMGTGLLTLAVIT